jgi:hypothetical protein
MLIKQPYVNYKSVTMTASLNKDSNSTYQHNEQLLLVTPEYNF